MRICQEKFGAPTILVNNAGIAVHAELEETTLADFQKTFAVNVMGVFLGMKAAVSSMAKAGGGAIVNISSVAGFMASRQIGAYVASKFAVRGLTRSGAFEFAKYGIRVNALCPGVIDTAMTASNAHADDYLGVVPMRRFGEPLDIANAVLYLVSDMSKYVTGSDIVVDGGTMSGVIAD